MKSTCNLTIPLSSRRAGAAYSQLLGWFWERGDYVIRGSRLPSFLSGLRGLQKPHLIGVLRTFRGRGENRRRDSRS